MRELEREFRDMFRPVAGQAVASTLPQLPLLFSGEFLQYAVLFFVLAVVAALVGARGIAGISMEIARIMVLVFLVFLVISVVL
jgi:uncharacterized membrane protein YtjA (UPF0391 family)